MSCDCPCEPLHMGLKWGWRPLRLSPSRRGMRTGMHVLAVGHQAQPWTAAQELQLLDWTWPLSTKHWPMGAI